MTDAAHFFELIDRYNRSNVEDRKRIDRAINDTFASERAVIALDMSGFTRTVRAYGVVHYLAMIRRMQTVTGRIMEDQGGMVFKFEADNLSGAFNTTENAVRGALLIMEAIAEDNTQFDASRQIRASVGIAFGEILWIPGYDAKGDPVNIAHKLGEDLAEPGEILVDASRGPQVTNARNYPVEATEYHVSGVTIPAQRIRFS
jgi:class 3 adenylate cyclase